jgi:hypothetical protein
VASPPLTKQGVVMFEILQFFVGAVSIAALIYVLINAFRE